jgi:hypothetical protein
MFGIRRGSAILRAAEGGDGGSGGGGATETFTEAQLAVIGQTVNSAITTHLKRSLPGAVAEGFKSLNLGETIAAEVAKLAPAKPAEGGGDDDKGKGGKGKSSTDPAIEQQLKDLATKLEASENARIAADKARVDAEQKRLLDGAATQFRNGLQPKLRSELLDVAVGHFGKDLKLAEDGSPLIRVKRAPYKGAPEQDEDVPLAEGLPLLLASEGMKPFLPPPGGANHKGGGAPGPQGGYGGAPAIDSKDPLDRVAARLAGLGMNFDAEFSG